MHTYYNGMLKTMNCYNLYLVSNLVLTYMLQPCANMILYTQAYIHMYKYIYTYTFFFFLLLLPSSVEVSMTIALLNFPSACLHFFRSATLPYPYILQTPCVTVEWYISTFVHFLGLSLPSSVCISSFL